MKNKCCFIIPYFGKFPETFQVFLKTCETNREFHWIIFTDDRSINHIPDNVQLHFWSFEELRNIVDQKFGFHAALESPYKLCDLKPAYGYIFEEYIKDYDFWGHCDIDTILGDLKSFLTDELLEQYDKLFCLGHFILYRNSAENNQFFMGDYCGGRLYEEVFKTPSICWFDEEWKDSKNINQMFLRAGKRVFQEDWSCNFYINEQKFIRTIYKDGRYQQETYRKALYIWKDGHIFRIYEEDSRLQMEEFMYFHFQNRKMKYDKSILNSEQFKIVPNAYRILNSVPVTVKDFRRIRKSEFCLYGIIRKNRQFIYKMQRIKQKLGLK